LQSLDILTNYLLNIDTIELKRIAAAVSLHDHINCQLFDPICFDICLKTSQEFVEYIATKNRANYMLIQEAGFEELLVPYVVENPPYAFSFFYWGWSVHKY